ncbi:TPA: hypothetical protein N0F65_001004 [Lagenidium giganteum]|uniref:Uncharacterized protein n=1 Tax=Lagenidium giganteum TaxID=4803 RepID=A0AAV2YUK2_9STRA|nr:TPA: hypothetical protein N0F65_001004 [Lagenidium giganteum]
MAPPESPTRSWHPSARKRSDVPGSRLPCHISPHRGAWSWSVSMVLPHRSEEMVPVQQLCGPSKIGVLSRPPAGSWRV